MTEPTQLELKLQTMRLETIHRIETTLKNLGAEYEIVFNGQTFGNKPKRKQAPKRMDLFKPYNIKEKLLTLEPGQHLEIDSTDGEATAVEIASNITARAAHLFGPGKVNCVSVDTKVLAVRHE